MATVNVVLITNREDKKGKCPIKIAVQHENKKKLFSLVGGTFKSSKNEWSDDLRLCYYDKKNTNDRHALTSAEIDAINAEIIAQKQIILDVIHQYEKSRTPWSFDMLGQRIEKKPKTALFKDVADAYIKSTKNKDTARTYISQLQSLINYCGLERYNKLTCSDINSNFIVDYVEEMKNRKNGKGLEYSTMKGHLVFIKTTLNIAIREKVASPETFPFTKRNKDNYFNLDKLKSSKTHRSLPDQYLEQLLSYKAYDEHDIHWQIFVFKSHNSALEFFNVVSLVKDDIIFKKDENGTMRNGIEVHSRKLRKTVFVELTPLMLRILNDVQSNYQFEGDRLFPVLTKSEYSDYELKRLKANHNHAVDYCKKHLTVKYDWRKRYNAEELTTFANQRFYDYGEKLALLLWRFSHSLDGINMLDMIKLKKHNIETQFDSEGNPIQIIRFRRSKTGVEISTSISKDAEMIISFFDRNAHFFPKAKDYLLPILTQEDADSNDYEMIYKRRNTVLNLINRQIKKIGINIGFPREIAETLSFYWARHTFAQRCLIGGASLERIQGHLGHLDVKTTKVYVSGFDALKKASFKDQLFKNDRPAV